MDVTYIIKNWLELQDSPTHAINIACKTCGMDKTKSPISFNPNLKPFLVIYTHSRSRKSVHRRPKRSLTCEAGVNECCRESLYISFAEIGWDNWIIKPEGYNAYFCKGSCISPAALTLSANAHNTVLRVSIFAKTLNAFKTKVVGELGWLTGGCLLQKLINGESRQRGNRPEITPCCAATQYQQLQLVYKVNTTVSTKILPNMIVESCGCF